MTHDDTLVSTTRYHIRQHIQSDPRHRWTVDWLSFHDLTPLTIYTLAVISVSFFLLGKWRVGGRGFSPDLTDLLTNASDEGVHSFVLANAFLWEG